MKRLSLQWRITLLTALLIACACVCMNLLLYRTGVTGMDALNGFMMQYQPGSADSLTIEIPQEEMSSLLAHFSQEVYDAKVVFGRKGWCITAVVTILSAAIAYFVSGRALKPLQQLAQQAQRVDQDSIATVRLDEDTVQEFGQLSRSVNRMLDGLAQSFELQRQFAGNAAHELRTPMTTIKGFVDGILDGTIPPEMQNHYLQLVSEETGRLARLIQNMLDLSKLESGEYQVNARMFNIWETITGVALSAEQRINDGMIDIDGLTMDEKVLVYADPDLIHQVAYNLLDNAIKFTPAGGTIRFSVEKLGPEVEISIWNSGQGISPEALPYVFQRFYKEDRSRGLHARGAGLGLNICKVLVNLSGGQIRVESQQGEWCRFVFTLPTCSPNPGGMKRLPDAAGQPGAVEDPASMKPVN